MTKSILARVVAAYFVLDLLFAPLVTFAVVQMLDIERASMVYGSAAILNVIRIAAWNLFLRRLFAPVVARAAKGEQLRRADRALQSAPVAFGAFYAVTWALTYAALGAWLMSLGEEAMPLGPHVFEAVAALSVAIVGGAFAFAYPLMSLLTAGIAGQYSTAAREHGVALDRAPSSLQSRIAILSLCLGLAPTLWIASLGYMKQIQVNQEAMAIRTRLAASELANGVERGDADAVTFVTDLEGAVLTGTAGEQALARAPEFRAWLKDALKREPAGLHRSLKDERAIAFRRIDSGRAAVAILQAPASASASFLVAAGAFLLVVVVWAPICAFIASRAMVGPLERLTRSARALVDEGRLAELGSLPVSQDDEIGLLTEQFNALLRLMTDLGTAADAIAKGDLRVTVKGEGDLPDAFRGMLDSLQTMVNQIRRTSLDLAVAATEIFAAAREQEAAASAQSSAMAEIGRTMESLSASAAHVSDAVEGVVGNAERTLQTTDVMVARIGQLNGHASGIGDILDIIRDIADRSDLLALNGSLEATRAGEGGRGFALVAGEMRRLAERVTLSVEDVKKLVVDIRASGSSTVMATEESRKLAEGTTEAARQITFVTQQQRSGTDQVSQSVRDITEVVAQTVAATTQTRTAAQGLKAQADDLAGLIQQFKFDQVG